MYYETLKSNTGSTFLRTFFFAVLLNACPSVEELKYLQSAGKRREERDDAIKSMGLQNSKI